MDIIICLLLMVVLGLSVVIHNLYNESKEYKLRICDLDEGKERYRRRYYNEQEKYMNLMHKYLDLKDSLLIQEQPIQEEKERIPINFTTIDFFKTEKELVVKQIDDTDKYLWKLEPLKERLDNIIESDYADIMVKHRQAIFMARINAEVNAGRLDFGGILKD